MCVFNHNLCSTEHFVSLIKGTAITSIMEKTNGKLLIYYIQVFHDCINTWDGIIATVQIIFSLMEDVKKYLIKKLHK